MRAPYVDGGFDHREMPPVFCDSQRLKAFTWPIEERNAAGGNYFEPLKPATLRAKLSAFQKKVETAHQNRIAPVRNFHNPSNTACSAAFPCLFNLSLAAAA